jgi:hypothetical protein
MDLTKLKVGTRIKLLKEEQGIKEGTLGTLKNGTIFHRNPDALRDYDGSLWATFGPHKKYCIASRGKESKVFRVIRY